MGTLDGKISLVTGASRGIGRAIALALAEALHEHGLAVIPGVAFGADAHLRLSFAFAEEQLVEGIERLGRALTELA